MPVTVLSIHFAEAFFFYLLRQDAIFPALNFLFDISIDSSIFLSCLSQCAGTSGLIFSYNSCCWIGTIGSAVFCHFDGMGATDSACTEVFPLMPSCHHK